MLDEALLQPVPLPETVEQLTSLLRSKHPSLAASVWRIDNKDLGDADSIGVADIQTVMWPEVRHPWMDPDLEERPALSLYFVSGRFLRVIPVAVYTYESDSTLVVFETAEGWRYILHSPDALSLKLVLQHREAVG